jgi:purine-binding chemotaxis protein CheW
MALHSSLKLRRVYRQTAATQQLLTFQLRQDWFALPVQVVQKVIAIDQLYGSATDFSSGLTFYQDRDISILSMEQRIFGESRDRKLLPSSADSNSSRAAPALPSSQFLLIVQTLQGEFVGLPLTNPPILRRVAESAFAPVPSVYLAEGRIRCVSALVTPEQDNQPLFLINLDRLLHSPIALPPEM